MALERPRLLADAQRPHPRLRRRAPYRGPDGTNPIGIEKLSFVSGLYGTGLATSNYAAPGLDSGADLTTWYGVINAGEPYDQNPLAGPIIDEITAHHSSYYVNHSEPPAPLLPRTGQLAARIDADLDALWTG